MLQEHEDHGQEQLIYTAMPIQDCGTQTTFTCSDVLANKIECRIRKNEIQAKVKSPIRKGHEKKFDDTWATKEKLFKFYTGITVNQFNHLYVLEKVGNVYELRYWKGKKTKSPKKLRKNRMKQNKITPRSQMIIMLMKLRQRFPNKDLAYRYEISISTVSSIINTLIQYLFKVTSGIRVKIFPSRELIQKHLPACFKSFKNTCVVIDCFEIFVQSSRNFAEQGNMYSSYKNHPTLKCLVGISPSGAITFLSDVYESSISDKDITVKSGLVDLLDPGDLLLTGDS